MRFSNAALTVENACDMLDRVTNIAYRAAGGAAFVGRLRRNVPPSARSDTNARAWGRLLPFSEVADAVSEAKGESWDAFVDRYGDPGRDLAIFVARKRCGLTLREIGEHAGMKDKAVSYACAAIGKRLGKDRELELLHRRVLEKLGEVENKNLDTRPLKPTHDPLNPRPLKPHVGGVSRDGLRCVETSK